MSVIWIAVLKNLGIPLLGAAWTFFKASDWYRRRVDRKYLKAVECCEAAVGDTWKAYYKAKKEALSEGVALSEAKQRAMRMAKALAIKIGATQGIDILKEVGEELLEEQLERAIRRAKREAMKPIPLASWFDERDGDV